MIYRAKHQPCACGRNELADECMSALPKAVLAAYEAAIER